MSENVRHMWVLSLNATAQVHEVMTEVSGFATKSSEQHAEMGKTRRLRDHSDCQKFFEWLQRRNPFVYDDECLHSLSLGLVSDGTDGVNCERSEELGQIIQEKLDEVSVPSCKIKRRDQIKPLSTLQNKIRVAGKEVSFNPTALFTRLTALAQREEENMEDFFSFELTQEPMSLFAKGMMRKPDKPSLRKALMKEEGAIHRNQLPSDAVFVVDGGALLHRVRWIKDKTFDELYQVYTRYVRHHYKSCLVVFDGYEAPSTK